MIILPVRMQLTACPMFWLIMIFLLKLPGLIIYFPAFQGMTKSCFSYFGAHCESKKKKIDPPHRSYKSPFFWVLYNELVHRSCIYINKYDVAAYRQKTKHLNYGKKVDVIKWLHIFLWRCFFSSEDANYSLSCVFFGHHFPTKASWTKSLFLQSFKAICSMPSFSTVPKLELFFFPKSKAKTRNQKIK